MNTKIEKKAKKTFIHQQDYSDCGIACLASVIKFFGGTSQFENLRDWSGTNKQGTTLLGLYQASHKNHLKADVFQAETEELLELSSPVILHLDLENGLQHYVVFYGHQNGKFIIGDPGKGIEYYSRTDLEKRWQSKTLLKVLPTDDFEKKSETNNNQKIWLQKLVNDDIQILGVSIFLGVLIAGLSLAVSVFNQKLIDDILPSKSVRQISIAVIFLCLLLFSNTVLLTIRSKFLLTQSKDFNIRIVNSFFKQLLALPKSFFDNRRSGDMIARLNDSSRIQMFLSKVVGNFTIEILILITSIIVLFFYSFHHGIIALLFLPIYACLILIFNKKIVAYQKTVMEHYAHNESFYINSLNGVETIKNSGSQDFFAAKNLNIYSNFQEKIFKLGNLSIRLDLLSDLLGTFFLACIIGIGSSHVINDKLSVGALIAIIGISTRISPALSSILSMVIQVQEAKIAFQRLYEMVNTQEKENPHQETLEEIRSINVKNISFRFAGRSLLLDNLSLCIQKGQICALLGESGSGKSTLSGIFQKFYEIEKGEIEINQIPLQNTSTKKWREKLGSIPQQIHLFDNTVAFNIILEEIDEGKLKEIQEFCRKWNFDQYFNQLPQGLMTKVGEEGINLSGGQKQLLAFARVLFRDPEFIILDEATSAMDRETEKFIFSILESIKKDTAILFITHRIHILKNLADKIYILNNKTIQNEGSHNELMLSYNAYSQFWLELEHNTLP